MRHVSLLFPDTLRLADFVIMHPVGHSCVNSREKTLFTILSDEQIVLACTAYNAVLT